MFVRHLLNYFPYRHGHLRVSLTPHLRHILILTSISKKAFSASSYAAFRPNYTDIFYDSFFRYHKGVRGLLVDLGTGHGNVARRLAPKFNCVFALDPSKTMIEEAEKITEETEIQNIMFLESPAEKLSDIDDGTADAVVSGEAAHWFDMNKVWPELGRILRSGGTLALWGYCDNAIVGHPKATALLDKYCYDQDKKFMGSYWEQPGRNILRDLYQSIEPPEDLFEDVVRREFVPSKDGKKNVKSKEPPMIEKEMTLEELGNYIRTFSAYHNWIEENKDRKPKKEGGNGDVVDDMFEEMITVEYFLDMGVNWDEVKVKVQWGTVILMAKRK